MFLLCKVESIRKTLLLCLVVLGAIPNLHGMHGRNSRRYRSQQSTRCDSVHIYVDNYPGNNGNNSGDSSVLWQYVVPGFFTIVVASGSIIVPIISQRIYDYYYGDPELKEINKEDMIVSVDLKRQQAKLQGQRGYLESVLRERQQQQDITDIQIAAHNRELRKMDQKEIHDIEDYLSRNDITPTQRKFYEIQLDNLISSISKRASSFSIGPLEYESQEDDDERNITSEIEKSLIQGARKPLGNQN